MDDVGRPVFLVPRGAEARAVRRAAPEATVVAVRAGARSADVPADVPPGPLVLLGLCGALTELAPGSCVIYDAAVDEQGACPADPALVRAVSARLPDARRIRAVTTSQVVTRAAERAALAAAFGAQVVDMEGTHLARVLAARGRPAVSVRVVSDHAGYDLPPIADAFAADGTLRPLHLARAFALRPRAAVRFIADVRRALVVLGETARALGG